MPATHSGLTQAANPSGTTIPIWYDGVEVPHFPDLTESTRADICVVGAGIAGLLTAYLLARAGKSVVVVDEKPVAGGESGRTSAHLASIIDDRFMHLERMHGVDSTRLLYQSHAAGIDLIERISLEHLIDCDFARLDAFLFAGDGQSSDLLDQELAAAQRAGVHGAERFEQPPAHGVRNLPCLRFRNQAGFHPLKFLVGLADVLQRLGVRIYCGSRMMDLAGDGPVEAKLSQGRVISADAAVSATNVPTPINNWMGIYTKQSAYRTYVAAFEMYPDSIADALYWDMLDPYHYVRIDTTNRRTTLLVGGEDHKTGQPLHTSRDQAPFARLDAWARAWFPSAGAPIARWSGQVNEPDDGVAFIGQVPSRGHHACYVITGDSGMGLTHGALGAMLVSDLILGRTNPWSAIYSPDRKPWHAPGTFVRENANAVAQFVDYVTGGEVSSTEEIPTNSGAVMRDGTARLAVYRDGEGQLHKMSAVCPHLKGCVHWNAVEHSWDCPCHGSRFDATGKLIMGPAIDDLRKAGADGAGAVKSS